MATAKTRQDKDKPTVIKKYANRRLYDTGRSSYVTLDDLCIMVKEGRDFVVYDAKSGEDLTHSVLTQIIVDQEGKGESLLPTNFLRQLIGFYGDNMQQLVPNYLEQTIEAFSRNQEHFRQQMGKSMGGMMNPVSAMEDISRKNMEMFENAMRAWQPFTNAMTQNMQTGMKKAGEAVSTAAQTATQTAAKTADDQIDLLKKNIAEMEKEISRLSKDDE